MHFKMDIGGQRKRRGLLEQTPLGLNLLVKTVQRKKKKKRLPSIANQRDSLNKQVDRNRIGREDEHAVTKMEEWRTRNYGGFLRSY